MSRWLCFSSTLNNKRISILFLSFFKKINSIIYIKKVPKHSDAATGKESNLTFGLHTHTQAITLRYQRPHCVHIHNGNKLEDSMNNSSYRMVEYCGSFFCSFCYSKMEVDHQNKNRREKSTEKYILMIERLSQQHQTHKGKHNHRQKWYEIVKILNFKIKKKVTQITWTQTGNLLRTTPTTAPINQIHC